ncbi:FAD:protein FMN transferase [Microbacterium rhizomatis]|uniref:FAD:protein FMN transferase n=1 Tax=Microbacterium rhizomatis TaxID=1631477 RepID=A0A5J5J4Z3_9MICO|nr:FAD:protein FMN transferase [Microbacterium rhizomatis]KAA9111141.1 FAD:protein FMN transferase [Microbacterium rhizomatis]
MSGQGFARWAWAEDIMGTTVSIHVITRAGSPRAGSEAARACFAHLREIDRVFSTYRSESDVSRLRGGAPLDELDPRVRDVADACDAWEIASRGRFTAYAGHSFDPSGYVKGWAVEAAARQHLAPLIATPGVVAAGINAGGDMQLFTSDASDWRWSVGIADPHRPGTIVATLEVVDGAVATSGTAERGTHIIDPRTGAAATSVASATVVADSLTAADVWATVAVVAGADDLSWIADASTRTGIVISASGAVRRWTGATEIEVGMVDAGRAHLTSMPLSSRAA